MFSIDEFKEIWLVDFEYSAEPGGIPTVRCLAAIEFKTGRRIRLWIDEIIQLSQPPYSIDENSLFVAYYAIAEFNCHLALGWDLPVHILDLFVEFRNMTNGMSLENGNSLLGALLYFNLGAMSVDEKDKLRDLAIRGGLYTGNEKQILLDYCESDVDALVRLLPKMLPNINIPLASLRGRYMKSAANMEKNGIPIDTEMLVILRNNWNKIQDSLITEIDQNYEVYAGRTFKSSKFEQWLVQQGIPWPRLKTGHLDLQDATFKDMARSYPTLTSLRELRVSLSQMRLSDLAVGTDSRNRCMLSAYSSKTGRNQPSNAKYIFGTAVWIRGLIKPPAGYGIAYIDWSQQEFGIAAALSGDKLMQSAYLSGDPYLAFAKQAGRVPNDATKQSHKVERDLFKQCVLAVQYGMEAQSLAIRIGQPVAYAKDLLRLHHETYPVFWKWSDSAVDHAMLHNKLWTVFGWEIHVGANPNPRSLRNFPMQANGAEMLRFACCMVTEAGIKICAPVHDAILIEAPLEELDDAIAKTRELMAKASEIVLDGFILNSDVEVVRFPDRYSDVRGVKMWETVTSILDKLNVTDCVHEH